MPEARRPVSRLRWTDREAHEPDGARRALPGQVRPPWACWPTASYEVSGHVNYTGLQTRRHVRTSGTGGGLPGSTFNGKYNGLNFGNGGVALTFAGFTLGANAIGGRLNGQLALAPEGAVPESPIRPG